MRVLGDAWGLGSERKEVLNVLDLFSGTGELGRAFHEALDWHGIRSRTVAYCERESYPQGILLSRQVRGEIGIAPISSDVKELTGASLYRALGPVGIDAIVAGFPCQDISTAGRGEGLDGKRSGLFFEVVRLAGELGPQFIALENVPAIIVRGGARVIAELSALGYDLRFGVMGADDVGATHKRDRWWCLAYRSSRERRERRGTQWQNGHPEQQGEGVGLAHSFEVRFGWGSVGTEWDHADGAEAGREEGASGAEQRSEELGHASRSGQPRQSSRRTDEEPVPGHQRKEMADAQGQRDGRIGGGLQPADGGQGSGQLRQSDSASEGGGLGDPPSKGQQKSRSARKRKLGAQEKRQLDHRPEQPSRIVGVALGNAKNAGLSFGDGQRSNDGQEQPPTERAGRGVGQADPTQIKFDWTRAARDGRAGLADGRLPARPPYPGDGAWGAIVREFPQVEPAVRGMADGMAFRADRIRAIGNGVDFVCAKEAFKILLGGSK